MIAVPPATAPVPSASSRRRRRALSVVAGIVVTLGVAVVAWFAGEPHVVRASIALERARNGLTRRTIVVDREPWYFLEGGDPRSDTIVLLHGFGADKDNWMRFAAKLVDRYHVIAPDLPGFGETTRHPDWDYRLGAQQDRVARFLATLGVRRFHLAGHSMGGHLAALYALARPHEVATLGLFAAGGVTEPHPSERTRMLARGENPLLVRSVADYDRLLRFVTFVPPFVPSPVKRYLAQRAIADRDFDARILAKLMSDDAAKLDARIEGIHAPTLVLWGDHDRVIDVSAARVFDGRIPDSALVVMHDTGHAPIVERPQEAAEIYRDFLLSPSRADVPRQDESDPDATSTMSPSSTR